MNKTKITEHTYERHALDGSFELSSSIQCHLREEDSSLSPYPSQEDSGRKTEHRTNLEGQNFCML